MQRRVFTAIEQIDGVNYALTWLELTAGTFFLVDRVPVEKIR